MSVPTIPNLPTDNLYKFTAIFGLTLVVLSLILYSTIYSKLSYDNIDLERKYTESLNKHNFEKSNFTFINTVLVDLDSYTRMYDSVLFVKQNPNHTYTSHGSGGGGGWDETSEEFIKQRLTTDSFYIQCYLYEHDSNYVFPNYQMLNSPKSLYELVNQNKPDSLAYIKAKTLFDQNTDNKSLLMSCIAWGFIAGVIMVLIGFTFWYYRHQRYVDYILKQDAKKAGFKP